MARINPNSERPTAKRPAEDEVDENGRTAKKVQVAGKGTRAQAAQTVPLVDCHGSELATVGKAAQTNLQCARDTLEPDYSQDRGIH